MFNVAGKVLTAKHLLASTSRLPRTRPHSPAMPVNHPASSTSHTSPHLLHRFDIMDPLSIAGSVSGLLAMSTAIVSALEKFTSAYSLAEIVHREMREFRSVLAQLQPLALGSSFSDIARASMIELRHVEVTLVGCLCTFSDLEREVDRLGAPGSTSLYIRFKWTRAQSTLNGLVQQLQNHKATLALMLAIMTW